jgi:hypothetical protein
MSAWLPTTLEPAIKTMITYCIAGIDNKAAALPLIITANRIEANPSRWSLFAFAG